VNTNVIPLPTAHSPAQCASCGTALHAIYHPHHFRKQTGGPSAPFDSRYTIMSQIPIDGTAVFYATTNSARAAVRGTAYNWGRACGRDVRFLAHKLCTEHVRIERVA